jgi:hypothetical protein
MKPSRQLAHPADKAGMAYTLKFAKVKHHKIQLVGVAKRPYTTAQTFFTTTQVHFHHKMVHLRRNAGANPGKTMPSTWMQAA